MPAPGRSPHGQTQRRRRSAPARPPTPRWRALHPELRPDVRLATVRRGHRGRPGCTDRSRCAGGLLDARDPLEAGPQELITNLDLSANNPNNPSQAGLTFLGQFVDHDVTFDASSRLGTPTVPADTRNFRSPALDLDSVYGDGPVADQRLYDPADGIKFRLESGGLFEDLPRTGDTGGNRRRSAQRRERDHLRPAVRLPAVPQQRRRCRSCHWCQRSSRRASPRLVG